MGAAAACRGGGAGRAMCGERGVCESAPDGAGCECGSRDHFFSGLCMGWAYLFLEHNNKHSENMTGRRERYETTGVSREALLWGAGGAAAGLGAAWATGVVAERLNSESFDNMVRADNAEAVNAMLRARIRTLEARILAMRGVPPPTTWIITHQIQFLILAGVFIIKAR